MDSLKAFPKIYTLGSPETANIFTDEVEVSEKIDGSQFVFGLDSDGVLRARSKGAIIDIDNPPKLFNDAVEYIKTMIKYMAPTARYYAEYLQKPKHNTLAYSYTPLNKLILFAVYNGASDEWLNGYDLASASVVLRISAVPREWLDVTANKELNIEEYINDYLKRESALGGEKVEGMVFKNYKQRVSAKYVSESFKERHGQSWQKDHKSKDNWTTFADSFYHNEARWTKAVQWFRDQGLLTNSPKDIGMLVKRVQQDIIDENSVQINEALWRFFGKQLIDHSTHGLAEFYKQKLLKELTDDSSD